MSDHDITIVLLAVALGALAGRLVAYLIIRRMH